MGDSGTAGPSTASAILVVDDEPEIRNFLRMLLEAEGYRVRVARDGQEGAALARADPPDLVLTDWAMPRLGGDGLCALLQSEERTRRIPIVLMSAVISSAASGYSAFLPKPFDLEEMLHIIRGCLDARGATARLPQTHADGIADAPAAGDAASPRRCG